MVEIAEFLFALIFQNPRVKEIRSYLFIRSIKLKVFIVLKLLKSWFYYSYKFLQVNHIFHFLLEYIKYISLKYTHIYI